VTDATPTTVTCNATGLTVSAGSISGNCPVVYGPNTLTFTATDLANNATSIPRFVVRDTLAPALTVSAPLNGDSTSADSIFVTGTVADANPGVAVAANGVNLPVTAGAFSRKIVLGFGVNVISIVATDRATNATTIVRSVTKNLPPNPSAIAPKLTPSVQTSVYSATQFLYSGSNPSQTGVAAGTIRLKQAALVKGKVIDSAGAGLSGVAVSVLGHPELGQTMTRLTSGGYEMVVNGGGELTLAFAKAGYLTAQRPVNAEWNGWTALDSVSLVKITNRKTGVLLIGGPAIQIAKGDSTTDSVGVRQAVLMIRQGTTMTATLPGGGTLPLSDSVKLRVTELTVGPRGPSRMPGSLPSSSAYTYAAEVTIDEAEAVGATGVQLSQPAPIYVDNFLNFPPGYDVPVGYYDRQKGKWIPERDGRVIKIVSVTGGKADLQLDTLTNHIAPQIQLDSLGITAAEQTSLASTYAVGKQLWRTTHSHFSLLDFNIYYFLDALSRAPQALADLINRHREPCCNVAGSVLGVENRSLGEVLPLTGTPYGLAYGSQRVPGYTAESNLDLQVVENPVPAIPRIGGAQIRLTVAGKQIIRSYPLTAGLRDTVSWDGLDLFGRPMQGAQPAILDHCYYYSPLYTLGVGGSSSGGGGGGGFGGPPSGGAVLLPQPVPFSNPYLCSHTRLSMGAWYVPGQGLGGWTITAAHAYDATTQSLHLGNGERRTAKALGNIITNIAGVGDSGYTGDGGSAKLARLYAPGQTAVGPDGSFYITNSGRPRISRVDTAGVITTFAGDGTGTLCPAGQPVGCGDGGPAAGAGSTTKFRNPTSIALGQDGSLYITDFTDFRIRKVSPNGIISTIAGTGINGNTGDNGLATLAKVSQVTDIAVGPDASIYFADQSNNRIRRIDPAGYITTFAGGGSTGLFFGDGGLATKAILSVPSRIAIAPDGTVYIADNGHHKVRKVATTGIIITTVAGNGTICSAAPQFYFLCGDGGPAGSSEFNDIKGLAIGPDGSVYILDSGVGRIRRVDPAGVINVAVGSGLLACSPRVVNTPCEKDDGDGSVALQAALHGATGLTFGPDGSLYIAESNGDEVRRIAPAMPGLAPTDQLVAAEDGSEIYLFDNAGKHRFTFDPLTGDTLLKLVYDSVGRLSTLTDNNTNVTTIQRNAAGQPTAILAPFGQKTTLTTDANGYLASVVNPGGETVRLWSGPKGLLDSLSDPRAKIHKFTYDSVGRLNRDTDPNGGYKNIALQGTKVDTIETLRLTTAMGRATDYTTTNRPSGDVFRVITDAAGFATKSTVTLGGTTTTVTPDSTTVVSQTRGDPRWGMQAPTLFSLTATLPSGKASTIVARRHDSLSVAGNPLSLFSQIDSVQLGSNINWSISTYTAPTRRMVETSPLGRQSFSTLDAQGRVVSAQVAGLDSVRFKY
ncbi:MAG: hypothetical protein SGI84_13015, partial [Gemmatimonadota bacterium]|nr:hypothetical protein [Gemmatimonadota bacterium]